MAPTGDQEATTKAIATNTARHEITLSAADLVIRTSALPEEHELRRLTSQRHDGSRQQVALPARSRPNAFAAQSSTLKSCEAVS